MTSLISLHAFADKYLIAKESLCYWRQHANHFPKHKGTQKVNNRTSFMYDEKSLLNFIKVYKADHLRKYNMRMGELKCLK